MASTSQSKRPSRKELRAAAARRRRNTNLMLIGGGVLLAGLVGLIIYLNIRSTLPVGAEESLSTLGNAHIEQGALSPIAYNSTPPTSGPHYGGLVPWGVYREPQRYEQLIHNLEDGGVVIYYQCAEECLDLVGELESLADFYLSRNQRIVLLPNDPTWTGEGTVPLHQDMESRIAVTAWQTIDKFDAFDADRIRQFVERYEGIDHHR
jgi:hypothetical protein